VPGKTKWFHRVQLPLPCDGVSVAEQKCDYPRRSAAKGRAAVGHALRVMKQASGEPVPVDDPC
jgi:hypothetical protein